MSASGSTKLVMTKWNGRVYYMATSLGTSVAWIRTKPLDLGDASVRKVIQRMILDITNLEDLSEFYLVVSRADNLQDEFVEEAPIHITGPIEPINMRPRNSRYFKFKFKDDYVTSTWKLSAIELLGVSAGKRA